MHVQQYRLRLYKAGNNTHALPTAIAYTTRVATGYNGYNAPETPRLKSHEQNNYIYP